MLDELLGGLVVQILARICRVLLFPVALLICTPFIVIRAAILAARQQTTFVHAVADGYSSVDVYWWS